MGTESRNVGSIFTPRLLDSSRQSKFNQQILLILELNSSHRLSTLHANRRKNIKQRWRTWLWHGSLQFSDVRTTRPPPTHSANKGRWSTKHLASLSFSGPVTEWNISFGDFRNLATNWKREITSFFCVTVVQCRLLIRSKKKKKNHFGQIVPVHCV